MNIFKDEEYYQEPHRVMRHYIDQQYDHLRRKLPDVPSDELMDTITQVAKERFKDPIVQRISFPAPGHSKKEIVTSTQHLKDIEGNITSPSGNTYCQPLFRESLIRLTIIENVEQRGKFKKLMFQAEQNGDSHGQTVYNNLQTSKKISNNSTPGAMQSEFNILSDKSGFNAITSTTRLGVKTAYGTVERLLAGNIFLPTYDDALSYIYNTISVMPSNCEEVLSKYSNGIRYVDRKDFLDWIISCMEWYSYKADIKSKMEAVVSKLTPLEMTYVYYAGSWYNLFNYNTEYFRSFIDGVFERNIPIDADIVAEDIFKIEDTLSIVVRGTNSELFGRDSDGNLNNLKNAITNNPEGVRQIVAYARHIERYLNEHGDLLCLFLKTRNETPQPFANHRLIRKATILCDTDSNLFTTNEIVRLYHGLDKGKTDFGPRSFDINALSVYILSRSLEHTFARYSSRSGIVGDDLGIISMKNEFLYPTFLRSNIGKHYNGVITVQEGNTLRNPKLDVKGVGYVGSTRPKEITDGMRSFLSHIHIRMVETNGVLNAEEILNTVAAIELKVLDSLDKGEKTYLGGVNVKQPETYADGGQRSCFYYRLWEEVFAEHFGIDVVLPNRFMKIPILGENKLWSRPDVAESFSKEYPEIYRKMSEFVAKEGGRGVNYLIAPASAGSIPDMFRPWLDKRKVISAMCAPYYLALKSLNLSVAVPDRDILVMDYLSGKVLDL